MNYKNLFIAFIGTLFFAFISPIFSLILLMVLGTIVQIFVSRSFYSPPLFTLIFMSTLGVIFSLGFYNLAPKYFPDLMESKLKRIFFTLIYIFVYFVFELMIMLASTAIVLG